MAKRAITFQSEINEHCGIRVYRNAETGVEFHRDDRGWWVERPTCHPLFATWGMHDEPLTSAEARRLAKVTVEQVRSEIQAAHTEAEVEHQKLMRRTQDTEWRVRHGLDRYESDPGRYALRVERDHEAALIENQDR